MPQGEKFYYGTHYSSPGYVIGYLLRKHPLWMFNLQSGKFDIADRLFFSIEKDWNNCYEHYHCVKELIPEFYENDTDFLVNKLNLELGKRQNKEKVNHVQLPSWANGSASMFLKQNRIALESDYVSENINHWIDLIFGCKQTGK